METKELALVLQSRQDGKIVVDMMRGDRILHAR